MVITTFRKSLGVATWKMGSIGVKSGTAKPLVQFRTIFTASCDALHLGRGLVALESGLGARTKLRRFTPSVGPWIRVLFPDLLELCPFATWVYFLLISKDK